MARAMVNQGFQIGKETTRGTSVSANKKLPAYSLKPKAAIETSQYTPMGYRVPTISQIVSEMTIADYDGLADYNNIVYPLSSLFGAATISQPDGVGAPSVYQWAWTLTGKEVITPITYTTEFGDATRAAKFTYGTFNSLDLDISRTGEAAISGEMIGQALTLNQTLTSTPTEVEVQPVDGDHWDVYFATTGSGLSAPTQFDSIYKAKLSFGDLFTPEWTLNSAKASFGSLVNGDGPKHDWSMTVGADAQGEALLSTYARDSEKIFIRLKATGETIATTYKYGIAVDFCAVVTDVDSFDGENGVYVMPVNMALAYDKTWAKFMTITITNTISSL